MVSPRSCGGALFYVVVTDFSGHPAEGIKEWVVGVPLKTGLMASCKTNNYLLNALTAMESQVPRVAPPPMFYVYRTDVCAFATFLLPPALCARRQVGLLKSVVDIYFCNILLS